MRKALITLSFLFTALVSFSQFDRVDNITIKDSIRFKGMVYRNLPNIATSLQELKRMPPIIGSSFEWIDTAKGGPFTVYSKAGFTIDSVTVIRLADTNYVAVRNLSMTTSLNGLLFGLNRDGVTDNAAIFDYLLSPACKYTDIYIPAGDYYCSHILTFQKSMRLHGADGYEMTGNGKTRILYPQGVSGMVINDNNASGSVIEGISFIAPQPETGRILEFNNSDGRMLYVSVSAPLTAGKTFEFRDPYTPEKIRGTAVVSNPGTANINYAINYTIPTGTFVVGDTVVGGTSSAKAVVRFVSKLFNALAVGTVSGTFTANETITGSISGATGKFVSRPSPASFTFAKVANISTPTGSLNNPSDSLGRVDSTILNSDSTVFNTTGRLDSIGSTGKRQNYFIEAGKYSVGITINRRVDIDRVTVSGFGGDGIYITNLTTPVSNANLTRLTRVRLNGNAGNGLRVNGGDANQISVLNSTMVGNSGFGINDISFLGITVNTVHTSLNLAGGGQGAQYINRKSLWLNFYSEGAFNGMLPWQPAENDIGGGAIKVGGTDGLANATPIYSTAGNSGAEYTVGEIKNSRMYTVPSKTDPGVIFKGLGSNPHPLGMIASGNAGVGRGPSFFMGVPYGSGTQRIDILNAFIEAADLKASQTSSTTYGVDILARRNIPPVITTTGSGGHGTGAVLQAEVFGGVVTKVNVLAGGKSYPLNGTTVTVSAPVSGVTATLNPLIEDSTIVGVQVIDGGSGYKDNDVYPVWRFQSDGSMLPGVSTNPSSIGTSANPVGTIYASNFVTVGGTSTPPTSLSAQDVTTSTEMEMLSLKITGNYGVGRGPVFNMYSPNGTGIGEHTFGMASIWDASGHSNTVIRTGDNDAGLAERVRFTYDGRMGLGTNAPQPSVLFQAESFTRGSLPFPRMGSTAALAIASRANGMMIYNTDKSKIWKYDSVLAKYKSILESDTSSIVDGQVLVGDSANSRFVKKTITGTGGIAVTSTPSGGIVVDGSGVTGSGSGSAPVIAVVASDVTNTTITQADITGLTASVAASKKYKIDIDLQVTAVANGIVMKLVVPSGATFFLNGLSSNGTNTAPRVGVYNSTQTESFQMTNGTFSGTSSAVVHFSGVLQTSTTAGSIQLQFRAFTSSTTEIVNAGSSMTVTLGQ